MFRGLLLKESLNELSLLDSLQITKTETWQVSNAVPGQPTTWTAITFAAADSEVDELAGRISLALKAKWYVNGSTDVLVYVIFPGKVFKYRKGDAEQRAAAQAFGRSVGIPEGQLDWDE
jgi:hypothetical protein